MFARATTLETGPDRIDQGIEQYRTTLSRFREFSGNQGAVLLVDRTAGKAIGITLWESEDAMRESRQQADQMRQQAASETQAAVRSVDEYEVAVWELNA